MATTESVKQNLVKVPAQTDLTTMIERSAKELSRALPSHLNAERLVRIALTSIRQNPELATCTKESFLGALFTAAQLGIEPVGGQAYILPFYNRKKVGGEWLSVREAQFVMGYKGLSAVFYRHEKASVLNRGVVHENDNFSYEYGTSAFLRHIPTLGKRGEILGYYVCAELTTGGKPFMYMSKDDCLDHGKKHSKTFDQKKGDFYDSSPWKTSPESMCLKTCLIQLAKLLPLSIEMQRAISTDETSRHINNNIDDVIDIPSTTNWVNESESVVAKSGGDHGSKEESSTKESST